MLKAVHPKLPMRNKSKTLAFYKQLGFTCIGNETAYNDYLMLKRDAVELHFFYFEQLNILENYGQVYIRVKTIKTLYQDFITSGVTIHPNSPLKAQPWGQMEFSLLDPDNNLLTFGMAM
jgi:hypothetical protein